MPPIPPTLSIDESSGGSDDALARLVRAAVKKRLAADPMSVAFSAASLAGTASSRTPRLPNDSSSGGSDDALARLVRAEVKKRLAADPMSVAFSAASLAGTAFVANSTLTVVGRISDDEISAVSCEEHSDDSAFMAADVCDEGDENDIPPTEEKVRLQELVDDALARMLIDEPMDTFAMHLQQFCDD
ncbi:hypothetical protein THAOC_34547 [Thalassiosira oceanica]|uniref:Uncharacterized protein n=1 Tax=Thalassiosira oceanica TaxID=159749 RepID=K0R3C1_THAOC|nr:hypothetical protein THAOC_34547 [Thalassiosira oceanica]|eukprot:EJK46765.1 hypothetical protein THAOC_34547 [Thalassiosira oceanica]